MADYNKNKLLVLYNILMKYTDENHKLTMQQLLLKMAEQDCFCSDDSVFRYIKQLRNELGVDIISERGRNAGYYIGNRLLETDEMKLLIDAVNASNFIESTLSKRIIEKLKSTMSIYEETELDRTVLGVTVAKAENKKILYNVNAIQEAIRNNYQISFDYYRWSKEKKLIKDNKRRTMNPWTLLWANDRYYIYGYDTKKTDGKLKERVYRIDKINNVKIESVNRDGKKQFSQFNANTFVSRRIGMFSGDEEEITLRIPEYLVGAFIDQFGKNITVSEEEDGKLLITFFAVASNNFMGWIIGMNNVELIKPEKCRENIRKLLEENISKYK